MDSAYPTATDNASSGAVGGARPASPTPSAGTMAPPSVDSWEGDVNSSDYDSNGVMAPVVLHNGGAAARYESSAGSAYPDLQGLLNWNPGATRAGPTAPLPWLSGPTGAGGQEWDPLTNEGEQAEPEREGRKLPPLPKMLDAFSWRIPARTHTITPERMLKLKVYTERFEKHTPEGERPFVVNPANRYLDNTAGMAAAVAHGAGQGYDTWCRRTVEARPNRKLENGEILVCAPYQLSQRDYHGIITVAMQNITKGTSEERQKSILLAYYGKLFAQAYDMQIYNIVMTLFGTGTWDYDQALSIWCFMEVFQGLPDDRLEVTLLVTIPPWVLYTDGSQQQPDGNRAKWAFILKHKDKTVKSSSGWIDGSAQMAEVTAILEGIITARGEHVHKLLIVTDRDYCHQGRAENLEFWEAKGYETSSGRPMAHGELWALIVEQSKNMRLSWKWIKSHTGGEGIHFTGNQEVDAMAQRRQLANAVGLKRLRLALPKAWGKGEVVEVPEDEADHIIRTIHVGLGHVGSQRLLRYLRTQDLLIPKARQRAIAARKACERCALVRGTKPEPVPLGQVTVPMAGTHFSADVFGPMSQTTRKGHKHGLVIADNGPGTIRVYPIKTPTAAIICHCISQFLREEDGVQSLRMDNATYFTHTSVKSLLEDEGIQVEYSVPYHAKTDDVAERAVRTVKEQIIKGGVESSWDELSSPLHFAPGDWPREGGKEMCIQR